MGMQVNQPGLLRVNQKRSTVGLGFVDSVNKKETEVRPT